MASLSRLADLDAEIKAAALKDLEACWLHGGLCASSDPVKPPHFASRNCQSNGRRWDPATHTFVGYPHCTCDWCF